LGLRRRCGCADDAGLLLLVQTGAVTRSPSGREGRIEVQMEIKVVGGSLTRIIRK
jgi:hypothetical protein